MQVCRSWYIKGCHFSRLSASFVKRMALWLEHISTVQKVVDFSTPSLSTECNGSTIEMKVASKVLGILLHLLVAHDKCPF